MVRLRGAAARPPTLRSPHSLPRTLAHLLSFCVCVAVSNDSCDAFFGYGLDSFSSFASPGYPLHYPPNQDCVRVIQARPGYDIVVQFKFFFQVETTYDVSIGASMGSTSHCPNDFVEFRDGRYGFSPLLGRFCGMHIPDGEIRARSGYLWMRFHSDDVLQYKGFFASYEMVSSRDRRYPELECHIEHNHALDGQIDAKSIYAIIPKNHTGPIDCVWRVEISKDYRLALYINEFQLAHPNQCTANFVEVYGGSTSDQPLKRYCGLTASPIFSTQPVLFVRIFLSDIRLLRHTNVKSLYSAYAKYKNCSAQSLFACGDDNCVPQELVCNGRSNCPYNKDEQACTVAQDAFVAFLLSGYSPLVLLVIIVAVVVLVLYLWTFKHSWLCCGHDRKKSYSAYLKELHTAPTSGHMSCSVH